MNYNKFPVNIADGIFEWITEGTCDGIFRGVLLAIFIEALMFLFLIKCL